MKQVHRLGGTLGSGLLLIGLGCNQTASAQVDRDSTLSNPSEVRSEGNAFVITGGTQSGSNLFHSFREFSVPTGGRASFQGVDSSIENVFSRVTGSNASRINGLLEVLRSDGSISDANFFLLNPNGIIFGPNATLNVGGSFLATTADRIDFADGAQFSATNPESALLTISVPVGLQFGNNPGSITHRSIEPLIDSAGNPLLDYAGLPLYGLRVPAGETLALVGGNVTLAGGWLTTSSGRIELGSIAGRDRVGITTENNQLRLEYSDVQSFGDIRLFAPRDPDPAFIDVSGAGGGSVQLQGDRISVTGSSLQSSILADTYGDKNGQGISIRAHQLALNNATISANTYSSANGGDIDIEADQLSIQNLAAIEANTNAAGAGGTLSVRVADSIEIAGSNREISSGLFARVNETATAESRGGNILLTTDRLSLLAGGVIGIDAFGAGNAGSMRIQASEIELSGVGLDRNGQPFVIRGVPDAPSGLTAFTAAGGQGGTIRVETDRLTLRDGATIQTATQGTGDAGQLQITARSIEVSGTARGLGTPTGLLTFSGGIPGTEFGVNAAATGAGGDLRIETSELVVRDGAVIAVGSLNPDRTTSEGAGTLRIQAENLQIDNQSALLSNTASGNGGDIRLQVQNLLTLRRNSVISSTAGIEAAGGNGGEVQIGSDFIVSATSENSDIVANAFTGNGGDITIAAEGIIGLENRGGLTAQSDISASSEFGTNGNIVINTPNVDPSQGLVELPSDVVDASSQIARTCSTGASQTATTDTFAEFVITGRGGVPATPTDARSSEAGIAEWVVLPEANRPIAPAPTPPAPEIVEAQGWQIASNGAVILTAHPQAQPIATAAVPCPRDL